VIAALWALPALAEPVRIATFHTELSRKGPGLLVRDIASAKDTQTEAVARVVALNAPDILVVQGVDWDYDGAAVRALAARIVEAGHSLPYYFAPMPNAGQRTGRDHDGDGRTDGWSDAQGFGRFTGEGGMAVLSRHPILSDQARDFSQILWADLPGAVLPRVDGVLFPDAALYQVQRLSSVAHWEVPVQLPDGTVLRVLTWHATTPVFDGPEDRNGLRNADETRFWQVLLDGALPDIPAPAQPFVLVGDANLDPYDGAGRRVAVQQLLADPRLQDPRPQSTGGRAAANETHQGDPALDTADWDDDGPGNLRVDYVLPMAQARVLDAGVFWPSPSTPEAELAAAASRHRLVWVEIELPR